MVMFKAKFKPLVGSSRSQEWGRPQASGKPQGQQQQQPQPQDKDEAPPIEKERGPQHPIKEPGPKSPPERAR